MSTKLAILALAAGLATMAAVPVIAVATPAPVATTRAKAKPATVKVVPVAKPTTTRQIVGQHIGGRPNSPTIQ
jgi:hypothetical protein